MLIRAKLEWNGVDFSFPQRMGLMADCLTLILQGYSEVIFRKRSVGVIFLRTVRHVYWL
jgi:hypothetical protein